MSNYITIENINHINAELSNFCNSACPMCPRYDSDLNLIKDISNNYEKYWHIVEAANAHVQQYSIENLMKNI